MRKATLEWISKAEGDWVVLMREWRARKNPNYDALVFHAQQCAEKYLKARMVEAGREPPRIHDLIALLEEVFGMEPTWDFHRENLASLTLYAVKFRYPGEIAEREDAKAALQAIRQFRAEARQTFELE